MSGSHMWVKQTLPTNVFVLSWFFSGCPGMLFLPCSPGWRLFSCVLLIPTPAHTHLRLIIADGSWQYLRPCWRSVPCRIVVLTSVSVAWLVFVLLCVPWCFFWPLFPSTCIDHAGPDLNDHEWEWIGQCVYLVLDSTKRCLSVCFSGPSLGIPGTLSLYICKYFTGVVYKSPFDCTVQSPVIEPCLSNCDM